jgi:hypothetical protein
MKRGIAVLILGTLALSAVTAASARVHVDVSVNPYGYGAYAPPVVYQTDPYYAAPPIVYFGGGNWGGGRERRSDHHDDHGRQHSRGHDDHGHQ